MIEFAADRDLEGLPEGFPNRLAAGWAPMPVDAETLIQWAISQSGRLPWRGTSERELMFDHGWTAIPKGVAREYRGGGTVLACTVDDDAAAVLAAIRALPAGVAAQIIACGRERIRPNCLLGVEPRRVARHVYRRNRKGGKKHRRSVVMVWQPCDPAAICAARDAYARWHDGVRQVADRVRPVLSHWRITGFAAPAQPWNAAVEQAA